MAIEDVDLKDELIVNDLQLEKGSGFGETLGVGGGSNNSFWDARVLGPRRAIPT